MSKIFFLTLLACVLLEGIEITPNKNLNVTPDEAEQMRVLWEKRQFTIDQKESHKLVKENRVLANAFLENVKLTDKLKAEISIYTEEKLAEAMVKYTISKLNMNEDILRSYYEENKHEFFQTEDIHFNLFTFTTYDDALSFYQVNKDNLDNINPYILEHNITKIEDTVPTKGLHSEIKNILSSDKKTGYITPPEKFYKNYIVIEVIEYKNAHIATYESVKNDVKALLYKKINKDTRSKLLKEYLYKDIR